ncbi:MAG TPA: 50S ribosomal protein L11 [Candidatus Nanoarchaeia archaeon]|nr:50S ribosomal protein L11 [Candidatus Nanoarchaeia archaeon]
MVKLEKIEMIVEGGKAAPGPAVAQKLGPMKINIGQVMSDVNKKTESFKGIKVPVKIMVNPDDKTWTIDVGSPAVTELIKAELKLEKGSGTPNKEILANVGAEQILKIAKMKHDNMLSRTLKTSMKQVAGSCASMGLRIEGKKSEDFNKDLEAGVYDSIIKAEKSEMDADKATKLKADLAILQEELKKELARIAAEEEAEKKEAGVPEKVEEAKAEGMEEAKEGEAKPAVAGKPGEKAVAGKAAAPATPGAKPAATAGKPLAPAKAPAKK